MPPKLIIEVLGDTSNFEKSMKRTGQAATGVTGAIGRLSIGFGQLVKGTLVVDAVQKALTGLHDTLHIGIGEFKENTRVSAQTAAALKSTGGVANVTARRIDELGLSLSNLSGVDDELIRSGENVLLSFTNIRDFAGKNNDVFTRATKAITDYSVRTGRDIPQAAVIIGRALEDPARRVASLSRAGIVFTQAQQKQLAAVEKNQGVLAAQKILLRGIEERFQGAAKAAGDTLPGQLNVLRDRFKDLAGAGIGLVAPAVSKATAGLTDFVRKLSEATGGRAKLNVAVTGLEGLGRDILAAVERQVDRIDFRQVGHRIGEKLRSVDWAGVAASAGRAVGDALVSALNALRHVIEHVNWQAVGKAVVDGIGLAIGAVVKFLISVNWKKVAVAVARTFAAALRAAWTLVIGAAGELGRQVVGAVQKGVEKAGSGLKAIAIKIALAVIEPFTHIPTKILGVGFTNVAQKAKKALEGMLDDMQQTGSTGGQMIGEAISQGISDGISRSFQTVRQTTGSLVDQQLSQTASAATTTLPPPPTVTPARPKGISNAQRNTFFDNALTRMLDRVQDIPTLQGQLARLKQIAGIITARIAATKDITRRLTLEDDLLNVIRQEKQTRQQIGQNLFAALQLNVDKAGLTKSAQDDLRALEAMKQSLQGQIKAGGDVVALEEQLVGVLGQIQQARQQQQQGLLDARNARQFRSLGLTATGEDVIPGVAALRRELKGVGAAIEGSFLDTSKTRSLISRIREVLSGGLGAVGRDVRDKVKQILDDLDQQLKGREGDVTKFRHVSTAKLLAGLGLDADQLRAARLRIAQLGPGGTIAAGSPSFALAGGGPTYVLHNPQFHGVTNVRDLEDQLEKRARSRASIRRGA